MLRLRRLTIIIQGNNDIVDTKPDKQLECFNMVWEEIAFLLKDDIAAYKKSNADIEAETKNWMAGSRRFRRLQKAIRRDYNT